MEILHRFKQHGYYTADLYHLLTKKIIVDTPEEIIPSEYQKEMKMSTEERLQALHNMNIGNLVINKNRESTVVLSFSPKLLVFQNFKPNDKIVAKFSVKNISSAPAFLNMVFKESSYFFVKPSVGQLLSRLAPGISVTFTVTFTPPSFEDYTHKISFYTDVDHYVLPLIAMGPRPIFDFPDQVTVPNTPLKVDSSTVMNIHNVGIIPAGFTLIVKTPFTVYPKSAYTSPHENIDIRVGIKTMTLGNTTGTINAVFETGENFRIKVVGTTHVVSVELEKQTVRFLDTFNTMARQQILRITNKSPHLLTYMCMKNSCVFDDFEEKLKLATIFYDYKTCASQKYRKLVHFDVVSSDEHDRVYTRIFFDELQSLVADESLQFQNMHFSITPTKGNLWPNKVTEITITFSPKEIGEFETVAFLDIDGLLDRVPLKLVGTSMPPRIFLNVETLDMEKVYINKVYNYEIVALNKGQINGVIVYKEVPTLFGSRISCTPNLHCLPPGEKAVFIISFCNSNQGPYFEEINFTIRDTTVVLKLYLKGDVIYPSLVFSKPCLDFGMISLGIPKTMELEVINESVVDVNAFLKVSSDGPEISAITLEDYAVATTPKPQIPDWPREFNIEPSKIHMDPQSRVTLQVTLTANLIRANQTSLELELEKSDSPPIALPIIFNAMVPEITQSPDIKLRACFIDYAYEGEIIFKANKYDGYFTINDDCDEKSAMDVKVSIKEGRITPNSTICIPITVKIRILGDQEYILKINLFGVSTPIDICQITGCGVRPMVTITPTSLHWGQVKVLTKTQKTLVLFNDSPVAVNFKTYMVNRDSKWKIAPEEGAIDPESELELTVSLYLVDVNTYTNKAMVQMDNVKDIVVPLTATGVGTSIVVGELKDRIDLGLHYTKLPLSCKVVMENCGTRMHSLEWNDNYKAPKTKTWTSCFFDLQPRSFKMAAGEKFDVTVTGLSNKVATVKEIWYLVGSIEGINKKELLLRCEVSADFVDPKIELSHSHLEFQCDFGPYSEYYKLTDIITIKNVSKLPLDVEISVKSPFAIIQKQSSYKISPEDENLCCCIYYSESDLNIENMNKELGIEQSKVFHDCLTLQPVEPLRKSPLNFFQDINKIKATFNLIYTVEEHMEDQDTMKLQVIFDTTKHQTLKSKIYADILRIKFNGHKNKDCLKITGSVNFPNIIILTPKIDFQCILNGSVDCKTIKIQNVTPLLACYKFLWRKCSITAMPSVTPKYHKMSVEDYMISSRENCAHSKSELLPFKVPSETIDDDFLSATEKGNESVTQDFLAAQHFLENRLYSESDLPRVNSQFTNVHILKKIMPMLDVTYESVFSWKYKFPRPSESHKVNVNDVLQLTPHRGLLKPGEVQYVHVIFKPKPNISVRAVLECEVLGGPTESVLITGQSSDLIYKISTLKLNFKIRSFHENATGTIKITNISRYLFGYKTYLNEPKFETYLEGTILDITPSEKDLESDQDCEVMVIVRPGVVGYFKSSFLLEIGHLPQIPIQVFGWGVIPQVYLTLSRPEAPKMSPLLGYLAIPSLTTEYLDAVNEFFQTSNTDVSPDSPVIDKYSEDPDLHDWYICSSGDVFPSVMDIELAIERMSIINHIKTRPELLQNNYAASKVGPIPGFCTSPYVVDFGVVITGSTVQCSADIINYGPIATKIFFAKGTRLPFWLSVKLCGKLNPGESGKIEITFSPSATDFTDLEENVETSFNLEVPYGATIPVFMKALSAVPYLMSSVSRIDFGSVKCGNKIICSIPLKNIGKPTCIWYVTLRLKAAGPNPMQVLHSSGKYEPGEGGWLSVSFKPTMEMIYEGMLVFRFHMNPHRMTIPIIGQGIVPHVQIIGPNVSFPPTLPWSETTEMYFGITNPCPFPVELIFIHSDTKWKEDQEMYKLLNNYYEEPEEILVPVIEPGAGFPTQVISFYRRFKDAVQKTMQDEAALVSKSYVRSMSIQKRGKSSPKATSKKKEDPAVAAPQKKARSEAEVAAAELQKLKDSHCDPLKDCMHISHADHSSTSISDEKFDKGLIIFVYGTPFEESQCQEIAYTIGKKLNLPTINVDQCIIEALCVSTHPSALAILTALEEMYQIYQRGNIPDGGEEEHPVEDNRDQFEIIKMKLEVLANSKNVGTPRSKSVDKKRKRSPSTSIASQAVLAAMGSTTMFQIDLLMEVLTEYLSNPIFDKGFIVDTLNSKMFRQPSITMTYILKCKSHITNAHLVMCHSDFSRWAQLNEETEKKESGILEATVYDENEISEIINSVDEMSADEYENANPQFKAIYVEHALTERRQKYLEKMPKFEPVTAEAKRDKKEKIDHTSVLTMEASESKKKSKKEDTKGKPTPEYVQMSNKYHEFNKNVYDAIINIANNWLFEESDLGSPLVGFTGQLLTSTHKKIKKKSDPHLTTTTSQVNFGERGFPITFIMCPCLAYKTALLNLLAQAPDIQNALKEEEPNDVLQYTMKRQEFSVLLPLSFPLLNIEEPLEWRFLEEALIKKCECNQITDLNLLDDSTQDNVLNILSKWHCTCGKRVASSQTSTNEIPVSSDKGTSEVFADSDSTLYPLPLRSTKTMTGIGSRIILGPGDLVRCKYTFDPKSEGYFKEKRYVEVFGWPESRVAVNVHAICDLPRLDNRPKKMFASFLRRAVPEKIYKMTYLDDMKVFEFGPIFIGAQRIYEEFYSFELRNSSLMTANVVIEFLEDTSVFNIDQTSMTLEPGGRGKITVSAAPTDVGLHKTVLLFGVKDNPEIVTVNIACNGVVPHLEILPQSKIIEYGRLLLYRRENDRFIVKNDSILPIMWKIRNSDDFNEDFIISQTWGIVQRQDNQVVPVTYIACKVGVIHQKPLIIDIYDSEGRGQPMLEDTLQLSAECYDVLVDCAYENASESFLNYGNVKVNSSVSREMYMLNRGKYNIYYKLKKVKNFPDPSFLRSFEISQDHGVLPSNQKLVSVEFTCTPTTSINLTNVPAFICSLLDGSKNQVVVAKFPVCLSIASFYNTFTLFPLGELNFHIIPVGSGVIRDVILNNTSKCPFSYEIVLPPEYRVEPEVAGSVKLKDNKLKIPPMRCGNFVVMNDDNLLAPGMSRTIQIQFSATAARKFEETIKFVISDTCPAEAQGIPLRLVGTGALPTLDFWNIETTFREHLIVKNLSEYKVPESSPHCVFVEETVTLYFFSVTINSSFTGTIDLYNNGLVASALTMKLQHQSNSNDNIFSLDKYKTHIEPLLHKTLGIIFTPKALEEYRAVLEVKLKLLDNQEKSYKICLIGEGVIPRINLETPPLKMNRTAWLRFPVTCLGSITTKPIRFKNITSTKSLVVAKISQQPTRDRPIFWLSASPETQDIVVFNDCDDRDAYNFEIRLVLMPDISATLFVNFNPLKKGRSSCDVNITIVDNPYEFFNVVCEAEAFSEEVIILDLEMLPMDVDVDSYKTGSTSDHTGNSEISRKKSSAAKKPKEVKKKKSSGHSSRQADSVADSSLMKYLLDFGGCELGRLQKRTVVLVNNSEKVYKFIWLEADCVTIKPSMGYIAPAEEKDLEILFFSAQPVNIHKESLQCTLTAVTDDNIVKEAMGVSWDNRQFVTKFNRNKEASLNERYHTLTEEQVIPQSESQTHVINIVIMYSAVTEYTKYRCSLNDRLKIKDVFIYKTRIFDFTVENIGNIAMKISWDFEIDEKFPARIDNTQVTPSRGDLTGEFIGKEESSKELTEEESVVDEGMPIFEEFSKEQIESKKDEAIIEDSSQVTLFSGNEDRDSVDTWFEIDLPFQIEPAKDCLLPNEKRTFTITFAPIEAFYYKVKLKSTIDNLDPYDQNITCKITARSLIPYCHLDIEESDYLTSGRRKCTGKALPPNLTILEFNVLGSSCYKKTFNVMNPTMDAYEFNFEMMMSDNPELVPVHCNMLKGFVEGGTSTEVTFTFSPTAPGVYESLWKFLIPVHNLTMNLLVVGIVREPDVCFVPTILVISNSLVGFTTTNTVVIRNCENETLKFEFRGNSLNNECGGTPVIIEPDKGILKARSETPIKIIYTPLQDGPLSFKIFCNITYMSKYLTLCVNALSYSIRPKVTYHIIGNEHTLNSDVTTSIYLEQTASTYERTIPFSIINDGSATFLYDWQYNIEGVKKYLIVSVEPKSGYLSPGSEVKCLLHFTLKQVMVRAYPVTLSISDGPEYKIQLYADIEKPLYYFSCKNIDFGKCIVNAPDDTYGKVLLFVNNDKVPIIIDLKALNIPELVVDCPTKYRLAPNKKMKINIFFRPKQVKEYEFKLQFWVNSLCEEIVVVRGEGVPLLYDLYEGCQKSFNLGAVRVGHKIIRQIEVMNHSKVPIEATFIFRDMYPAICAADSETTSICLSPKYNRNKDSVQSQGQDAISRVKMLRQYKDNKIQEQIEMDIVNALSSLKVIPSKCVIKPFRKVPLKIQLKPIGLISNLDVQLNMKVLQMERPLVKLSGSATGMDLSFSQTSLQFGRVRKRGCKILKVMLLNKGDFGARFWWQPLKSSEFVISPMKGSVAARNNVTFTVTFRPLMHNPFIKVWASCNIENYIPLEVALYASCLDIGTLQNKTIVMECPVREVVTEYVVITNPTDDLWLVTSDISGGPFETLKEFNIEPNSTFEIPIHFKPKTIGSHECQILYSPLGESALYITLVGTALQPNPNGDIQITATAKEPYTEELLVYNITEFPESYIVSTEIVKVIPDKFDGHYELKSPEIIKVWGEAAATCRWTYCCYEECEMHMKVMFINEKTREYQYYNIIATVTTSRIVETLTFVTRARESLHKDLVISNPLPTDADFTIKCGSLQVPSVLTIKKNSEATLTMIYSPLVVGNSEDYLEVTNALAGTYIYKVILKCTPAKKKNLEFTTPLGMCIPIRVRVQNRTDFKTEFICTVNHPSILINKDYILGPNEKGKFMVYFEPTVLGEQYIKVSFNSPVAGEYVYNIKGTATPPKPLGPYLIKSGGSTSILFKNIFDYDRAFKIHTDREEFTVKLAYETVKSKKELKVSVNLGDRINKSDPPTGCLNIETAEGDEHRIVWTYFLQGVA